ncbi:MAG: hypothetical protein ACK45J_08065 [Acidimicrobiaceae bacterium]|jgi:hypothetical protein|nr:hypothetical protein [Ilumatobacteraceae bacterium]
MIQRLRWAAYSSLGTGLIHGIAVGLHSEHASAARSFLLLSVLQLGWGIACLSTSRWQVRLLGLGIHGAAIGGWILTRTSGIAFIDGLQIPEDPQAADSLSAVLSLVAVVAIAWATQRGDAPVHQTTAMNAGYLCAVVGLLGAWTATGSVHVHGEVQLVDGGLAITADGVIVTPGLPTDSTSDDAVTTTSVTATSVVRNGSSQSTKKTTTTSTSTTSTTLHGHVQTSDQANAAASGWPRAYDPSQPVNLIGIEGFTPEQGQRALALLENTKRDLPTYANYATAIAAGYVSIGDESSGHEHLIKYSLLNDNRFLDTTAPESLVYKVVGTTRILVSAMYIAPPGTAINDTTLVNYGGGLLQWHVHDNLCWRNVNGIPKVIGALDANGNCPPNSVLQRGGAPMVHVWIAAHACGPFAALEGVGAGLASEPDNVRVDKCNAAH